MGRLEFSQVSLQQNKEFEMKFCVDAGHHIRSKPARKSVYVLSIPEDRTGQTPTDFPLQKWR